MGKTALMDAVAVLTQFIEIAERDESLKNKEQAKDNINKTLEVEDYGN